MIEGRGRGFSGSNPIQTYPGYMYARDTYIFPGET